MTLQPIRMQGNLYTVCEIPGRGQATIATSKIPKGTRIIAEHPLITIPRVSNNLEAVGRLVDEQLEKLDNEQRTSFFKLYNAHLGKCSEAMGIVKTNALPLGSSAVQGGIFLQSSRINHSCLHNAQNTWNENTRKLTIHLFKDVEEGEEVTIAYLDQSQDRTQRQRALEEAFGFVCFCELCSLPHALREKSDQRLAMISRLDDSIGDFDRILHSPQACIHDAHKLRLLLQEEGIIDARVPRLYYDAFQIVIANGDQARASIFAERAYAMRIILEGADSPTSIKLNELAHDPTIHSLYGTSMKWKSDMDAVPRKMTEQGFEEWLWREATPQSNMEIANLRDCNYFPAFKDLPDENSIDLDFYDSADGFHYTPRKHWCLLAEVVEVNPFIRLMLLVRDIAGKEIPVYFYTDDRGTEPSIRHVQSGNTIAILYAHQHGFMDLSTGIRQEEVNTIRIFPFKLNEILRLNDNIQASSRKIEGLRLCHGCGHGIQNPRKCGKCSFVWYCNKECQSVGWKYKNHKSDCKMLTISNSLFEVTASSSASLNESRFGYKILADEYSSRPSNRKLLSGKIIVIQTLRRDMYSLGALGTPINQAQPPDPDPLTAVGYSCVYWVEHLEQSGSYEELQDDGTVDIFLRTRSLYWFEALSLLRSVTDGIMSIQNLRRLLWERSGESGLSSLVQDAYRFILYHRAAIENSPLQAYGSALVFIPNRSIIKMRFQHEWLKNIPIAPPMGNDWHEHTGSCLQTLEGHNSPVNSVVFSHDSSRVASGSDDKTIKIWDVHSGACLQTLGGHSDLVNRVVSGSDDNIIGIWAMHTGAGLQTLKGHDRTVKSVVFSPDSSRVASGSDDKTIKIWNAHTGACLQTLKAHDGRVNAVVFSTDSSRVISGSEDNKIMIWDVHTGTNRGVRSVVLPLLSHDSSRVASNSHENTIRIRNAQTGRSVVLPPLPRDSSRVESESQDSAIKVWDAHTSACLQTLEGHNDWVNSVKLSHNNSRVVSGSDDNMVKIWDAHTGACLQTLGGHDWKVTSVVFSHDSSRVASGSYDRTIKIWDAHTGTCLQTLEGHDNWVRSVMFSHDSSRVASGSWDKTIKIWDMHTDAFLKTTEGHDDWVKSVVFSPDSSRVASGSWDKTIKIWDAQSGACLRTLEGHDRGVYIVVFSHDSSRVASVSWDNSIKIWDVHTAACLQTISITSVVINLSFNATGSSLFTNIGTFALCHSPTPAPTNSAEARALELQSLPATQQSQILKYQGYGISSDGLWITLRSQNWLWLPPTYRPTCPAVARSGFSLALGCQSGRVLIFGFASEDSN